MEVRRLVVNADDFGYAHDVNRGIVEAHTRGILTATTLMANGAAFTDAVELARKHPTLDIGCHLVLVGGDSLTKSGRPLPASVPDLIRAALTRKISPYDELKAQIERILASGIRPLHLDTHKHTHLWPAVLDAVCRLSEEFRIPWVRRPFDFPLEATGVPKSKQLISRSLGALRRQFHRKLSRHGCRTTDYFAGFQLTGRFGAAELSSLICNLPAGVTEFMCHPGLCTDELRGCRTRLKESREQELEALVSSEVRDAVERCGVQLVRFGDLN